MLYILAGGRAEALHWARIFELMVNEWIYIGPSASMLTGRHGGQFVACPSWFNNHGNGPWAEAETVIDMLAITGARRDFERQAMIDLDTRHRRAIIIHTERRLARMTAVNAQREETR